MNKIMMQAFYDELMKIAADFSLVGPEAIGAHGIQGMQGKLPEGFQAGPSYGQFMKQREATHQSQLQASTAREAKMNSMLQSGEWNPATHTVNAEGNLIPKKPMAVPSRASRTAVTSVTGGRPVAQAAGPGSTQILHGAAAGAPRAAAGAAEHAGAGMMGRLGRIGSKMRGAGKMGLGLAAMGLAGGVGGAMGSHQSQPAMG